jgi:LacI family transcriptional regulator
MIEFFTNLETAGAPGAHRCDVLQLRPRQRSTETQSRRRSRTIGVVVPDITMGLFPAIVRRLAKRAAFSEYQLILTDSQEDVAWERERVCALIQRKIDGLVVMPCRDDSPMLEDVRQSGIPTVLLDRVAKRHRF